MGEENAFHLIVEQSASMAAIPIMPRATSSHWLVKFNTQALLLVNIPISIHTVTGMDDKF